MPKPFAWPPRWRRCVFVAFAFAPLLGAAPLALAVDCTWTGGAGAWGTASNWDCNAVPSTDDAALVTANTDAVTLSGGTAAAKWLFVYAGRLDVSGGAVLSTTDGSSLVWIGRNQGDPSDTPQRGDLRVSGAGSKWQAQWASITVGNGNGATGAIAVDDGGDLYTSGLSLGTNGGNGTLAIGALPGQPAAAPGTVSGTGTAITLGGSDASTGHLVFNHTDTSGNYAFTRNLLGGHGELLHLAGVTRLAPTGSLPTTVGRHYFTGRMRVAGGTLVLALAPMTARGDAANGIAGGIAVESGGTLAGLARLGDAVGHSATPITVQAGGTLAPGFLDGFGGTLTVAEGGVTAQAGAALRFGVGNLDASQLAVAGPIDLGGATLALALAPGFAPAAGQQWTLVDNTGPAPVQGQFAQGTVLNVGGRAFQIDYAGGDGNDVVLTLLAAPGGGGGGGGGVAAVPTLGEWSLLLLGLLAAAFGARGMRGRRV